MTSRKPVISEPLEVDQILTDMGLVRDGLVQPVRVAEQERSFVTANDPIGFASYVVYAKAGRALREWWLPKGWLKDDSNNQTAIKNPKTKIRIVLCNFDELAGNPDPSVRPANRSPKGEVSRKKSACNRTAWLPGLEPPIIDPKMNDGYQTWLLGMHIDDTRPTGAELSFPVAFDGRYFTQYGTRIILIWGDEGGSTGSRKSGDLNGGPDGDSIGVVDIPMKRK